MPGSVGDYVMRRNCLGQTGFQVGLGQLRHCSTPTIGEWAEARLERWNVRKS